MEQQILRIYEKINKQDKTIKIAALMIIIINIIMGAAIIIYLHGIERPEIKAIEKQLDLPPVEEIYEMDV